MAATLRRIAPNHSSTPVATMSPSVADIAWAAGFLEGEATFAQNKAKNGRVYARIEAFQNHIEPLLKLQAMFGGSVRQRPAQREGQRGGWFWGSSGPRARGVLMTIFTFMSPRRRAEIRPSLCEVA